MKTAAKQVRSKREAIVDQLNWRYATKQYDAERRIPAEEWETLRDALTLAPSSYGLQPYKFIVVENKELREKLKDAAYGQTPVTDASHLVVLAYKKEFTPEDVDNYIRLIADGRGQKVEELSAFKAALASKADAVNGNGTNESWSAHQTYIALGFLLETAALLGIDATPMEGFDPEKFNEILGLKDHSAVVLCALGYRDPAKDPFAGAVKIRKPEHLLFEVMA